MTIRIPLKDRGGVRFWLEVDLLADYNVYFGLFDNAGSVVAEHLDMPGDVAHDFMNVLGLRPWDHPAARSENCNTTPVVESVSDPFCLNHRC